MALSRKLSPYATLSTLLVLGAIAVAWASRGRQRPAGPSAGSAQAALFSAEPFTARMTIVKASGAVYHGTMYAGKGATRTDVEVAPGKMASAIERYGGNSTWVLMPTGNFLESPISVPEDLFSLLGERSARIQGRDLGPEQVGAYPCEKYQIEATMQGRVDAGYIWVARAAALRGFIVMAQRANPRETVTLSDIRLGAPKPSVFEIPAGYHKLTTTAEQGKSR